MGRRRKSRTRSRGVTSGSRRGESGGGSHLPAGLIASPSPSPAPSPSLAPTDPFPIGTRVQCSGRGGRKFGTVAFAGRVHFTSRRLLGVVFERRLGKTNGTVEGHSYFSCPDGHGIFCRPDQAVVLTEERYLRGLLEAERALFAEEAKRRRKEALRQDEIHRRLAEEADERQRYRARDEATPPQDVTTTTATSRGADSTPFNSSLLSHSRVESVKHQSGNESSVTTGSIPGTILTPSGEEVVPLAVHMELVKEAKLTRRALKVVKKRLLEVLQSVKRLKRKRREAVKENAVLRHKLAGVKEAYANLRSRHRKSRRRKGRSSVGVGEPVGEVNGLDEAQSATLASHAHVLDAQVRVARLQAELANAEAAMDTMLSHEANDELRTELSDADGSDHAALIPHVAAVSTHSSEVPSTKVGSGGSSSIAANVLLIDTDESGSDADLAMPGGTPESSLLLDATYVDGDAPLALDKSVVVAVQLEVSETSNLDVTAGGSKATPQHPGDGGDDGGDDSSSDGGGGGGSSSNASSSGSDGGGHGFVNLAPPVEPPGPPPVVPPPASHPSAVPPANPPPPSNDLVSDILGLLNDSESSASSSAVRGVPARDSSEDGLSAFVLDALASSEDDDGLPAPITFDRTHGGVLPDLPDLPPPDPDTLPPPLPHDVNVDNLPPPPPP